MSRTKKKTVSTSWMTKWKIESTLETNPPHFFGPALEGFTLLSAFYFGNQFANNVGKWQRFICEYARKLSVEKEIKMSKGENFKKRSQIHSLVLFSKHYSERNSRVVDLLWEFDAAAGFCFVLNSSLHDYLIFPKRFIFIWYHIRTVFLYKLRSDFSEAPDSAATSEAFKWQRIAFINLSLYRRQYINDITNRLTVSFLPWPLQSCLRPYHTIP